MNSIPRQTLRVGFALTLVVALLLFLVRAVSAQEALPSAPLRLTLGEAARMAARQSAQVQGAQYRMEEAEARIRQRRSELMPRLSADATQGGRSFNTATLGIDFPTPAGQKPFFDPAGQVIGPVNTTDLRGRVSSNIFDYSAVQRIRSARVAAGAASADVASFAEQSAALAAIAYLRTLRSYAQLEARKADSTLAAELLGIAREQLRAGVGVGLDVTRAQSQLATVRAQLIAARNDRDRARLDLLRALNVGLDTPVELTDSLANTDTDDLTVDEPAAIARALRDRPDLRAAEEQLRAAQQGVVAIRSERYPSLSAFGDQGLIGKTVSHLLPTYTYGVQVSLPIFDGFRREGRIEEQEAVSHELDVRRRDLRQQASIEVRGALLDLSSAHQQVGAARERLQLAEQEVSQARERFRAGVAGNADVVTASLTLNNARSDYVDALTQLQSSRVTLARAEGVVTQLR
jgi:outer membrane protein